MADELQNARIDQLPLGAQLKPGWWFPVRNMELGITERYDTALLLSSGTSGNFEWVSDTEYLEDAVVTYGGSWWQALGDNENVTPGTDNAIWVEIPKSYSGLIPWVAGVYTEDKVFVMYDMNQDDADPSWGLYALKNPPTRPFVSSDFEAELVLGYWVLAAGDGAPSGSKLDSINTIISDAGNFILNSAVLTALNAGASVVVEGDNTGDVTIPPNGDLAIPVGKVFALRSYAEVIEGSGVTIVGSRGDLLIPENVTVVIEKTGTNTWLLHNGGPGGAGIVLSNTYTDIAALLADQANQGEGKWYMVTDASADTTVDTGWAIYQKLAATTAALTDYLKTSEQESLDVIVTNGSETVKGIYEEATPAELQSGASTGGTGAKLIITPAKLTALYESIVDLGNLSGAVSIDLSAGRHFKCVATGNITSFTFTNEKVGANYSLSIETGTSNKTIAFTAAKFRWPHGTAAVPQLTQCTANGTTPAKAIDIFALKCTISGRLDVMMAPNMIEN